MVNKKRLERYVKGFANHRRIEIMQLLEKNPGLSLLDIADRLRINFKTASEHTFRLHRAGLIVKKRRGNAVEHKLSNRGQNVLKFLRKLE